MYVTTVLNVVCAPPLLLGTIAIDEADGIEDEMPGLVPPSEIEIEEAVDAVEIGADVLEVSGGLETAELKLESQLGRPGRHDVMVMTLVVNTTVVDSPETIVGGSGSTVGACDGCPEKLGSGRGVAKIVPFGALTSSAESCTFPSS